MMPDEYFHGKGSSRVQFICGAIFGFVAGIALACRFKFSFVTGSLAVLAVTAACAFLARRWGDRFWEGLMRAFGRRWF